ncbi:MAG: gamma-glutamyltransferase, partial [Acidobacteriota bacterium]
APGKRPLSSMTPVIVARNGKLAYVLGSPGGTTIPATLVEVLLNLIDLKMPPQAAVDAPRFHHQGQPDRLEFETLPPDVRQALARRGYTLHPRGWSQGDVQLIAIAADGSRLAASDPRRGGAARGE